MSLREIGRVGHFPSLIAALVHFEVSFAVWVMLGVLAPFVLKDLGLSPALGGLVVATPLLAGSALRVPVGWMADRLGPRRIGVGLMVLLIAPLAGGWLWEASLARVFGIGLLLGFAGASFAVALPLASRHYPASHRGLALGIAGAGNSGTILAGLVAPRLAERVGWHTTFGLAIVPVVLAAVAFRLLAKEAPPLVAESAPRRHPLLDADGWRLCGLYAFTFGGFVGLASYLPVLLIDRYGISPVAAGTVAAAAAGAGSFLRPVGGLISDRLGGTRVLLGVCLAAAGAASAFSAATTLAAGAALLVVLLGVLGVGNGAVMQLVSVRFGDRIGLVTGVVGAAGGLGGFFLPTIFGTLRQATGTYGIALWLFAAVALVACIGVVSIRFRWIRRHRELALEGAF